MKTFDDWKTEDDTPEPEPPDRCAECGHHGTCDCSCCWETPRCCLDCGGVGACNCDPADDSGEDWR